MIKYLLTNLLLNTISYNSSLENNFLNTYHLSDVIGENASNLALAIINSFFSNGLSWLKSLLLKYSFYY